VTKRDHKQGTQPRRGRGYNSGTGRRRHLPPSAGVGPFTGPGQVRAALAGAAADNWLDASTIKGHVTKVVVDGDTAVGLESKTATTPGEHYVNDYCWVFIR
jgi:hypothetical protein